VHVLASAPPGSAWTFGGSILTFAFPMILTIVVAAALYVVYTKPEVVPGHQVRPPERPVSYTPVPGPPPAGPPPARPGPGQAARIEARAEGSVAAEAGTGPAAETSAGQTSADETSADEAGRTEGAE